MVPVVPAQIALTGQGDIAQARHVFLGGNLLPERWSGRAHFTIIETGFGAGLNFLAAWHAMRADPHRPKRLHFISVERNPLLHGDLLTAHAP